MTTEAHEFFARYRKALADFDHRRLCRFFDYPNMVIEENDTHITVEEQAMQAYIAKRLDFYRDKGVTEPRVLSLIQTEPSDWLIQASVTWGLYGENNKPLVRFHATYTLKQIEGEWKIVFVIAHDEPRAFRAAENELCLIGESP